MSASELRCGVYKHYKGGYYQVLGVGAHTETEELFVVYIGLTISASLPGPRLRLRPLAMFLEEIEWPTGERAPRFSYIGLEIPKT
jgi:hypothetical protein